METVELTTKLEKLVTTFDNNLSKFIVDGDVPTEMRGRLEFLQDKIAETYLIAANSAPVIKVTKPIIPELTNGKHTIAN